MPSYPSLERLKKLISALSSSQKRDFRRYIQAMGGDSTRYVRLFDAIGNWLKLRKFPDLFLDELVARKAIRKPDEFSAVAGILYEKILESMRDTPRSRSAKNQLRGIMCDVQFLADMELYPESLALLEKAREMAKKYEYIYYLLDLYSVEREILFLSRRPDFFQRLEDIRLEEDRLIEGLHTDQSIYGLNIAVLKRLVQNEALPGESKKSLRHWHENLQQNEDAVAGLSFRTQRRLNIALMNDVDYISDRESLPNVSRLYYARRIVDLYDHALHYKMEEPDLYIQHLGLFLSLALERKDDDIFEKTRQELSVFEGSAAFYRSVVPVFLHWYYLSGKYEAGCTYISELDLTRKMGVFQEKMTPSRYLTICFTAFELHWLHRMHAASLQWLERIISYKPATFHIDLQCYARFLQIPVMYDCRIFHTHLNPSAVTEALQRWLRTRGLTDAFYQNLLCLAQEIVESPDHFHTTPTYRKALLRFENDLPGHPSHSSPLRLMLAWCKGRAEDKLLHEMLDA